MKHIQQWLRPAVLVSLLAATPATESSANDFLGSMYLSAFEEARVEQIVVPPLEIFNVYLIIAVDYADIGDPDRNGEDGFFGWECFVEFPPEVTVGDWEVLPLGSLNFAEGIGNFFAGTGQCILGEDTPFTVVRFDLVLFEMALDLQVTMREADPPPLFTGQPVPAWASCSEIIYWAADVGTFIINPGTIAADATSWGELKDTFAGN